MAKLEPIMERRSYNGTPLKRVSWASIFAGAVVGIAAMVTFAMLGVAIGAIETGPTLGLANIPWIVVGVLAMFVGGWTAGRLCGLRRRFEGGAHGLVTWALATVALMGIVGPVSISMLGPLEGWGESHAPIVVPPAFEASPLDRGHRFRGAKAELEHRAGALLRGVGLAEPDVQEALVELRPHLSALVHAAMRRDHEQERDRVIKSLVARTEMERGAAAAEVDVWIGEAIRWKHERPGRSMMSRSRRAGPAMMEEGEPSEPAIGLLGKRQPRRWERSRRRRHAILSQPGALAAWSFAFLILGAAAAVFGGLLGAARPSVARKATTTLTPTGEVAPSDKPTPGKHSP